MAEKTRRGYVFFDLFIWIFHIRYSVRSTGSTIRFSSAGDLEYYKYKSSSSFGALGLIVKGVKILTISWKNDWIFNYNTY